MRTTLVLILIGILPGCRRDARPAGELLDASSATALGVDAASPIADFFANGPVRLGTSIAEIEALHGPPLTRRAIAVANRHDTTVTDSIVMMQYDGLVAEMYRAAYHGYSCETCLHAGQESIAFTLERGVVSAIEFSYWVD